MEGERVEIAQRARGVHRVDEAKGVDARIPWLDNAYKELDRAVFAAYGWPARSDRRRNPRATSRVER
jgi:hypothetical protein